MTSRLVLARAVDRGTLPTAALVQLFACTVVQNHKVTKRKDESADVRALALEQCSRLGVSTRCIHELVLIVARLPNRVLTVFGLTS